jgi:hypothetical protein
MEISCIRHEWQHVANETSKLQDEEQWKDEGDAGETTRIVTRVLSWVS